VNAGFLKHQQYQERFVQALVDSLVVAGEFTSWKYDNFGNPWKSFPKTREQSLLPPTSSELPEQLQAKDMLWELFQDRDRRLAGE